jgi:acetyl esterase/lipase
MEIPLSHTKHTRIYKIHDDTPIHLDIYHPHVTTSNGNKDGIPKPRPILLYFHGGYLVRSLLPTTLFGSFRSDAADFVKQSLGPQC